MPSEMRRPAAINVDDFVAALDVRLRVEVGLSRRWALPDHLKHPIRALRVVAKPMIQSGSMVLTALAVIIAVGAAPATVATRTELATPLAAPSVSTDLTNESVIFTTLLPADDILAIRVADNPDTPSLTVE